MRTRKPELSVPERIAVQAIRGINNLAYTQHQKDQFYEKYKEIIDTLAEISLRKNFNDTAILCGVLLKCALKYGPEKAYSFAKNFKHISFNGQMDPVHLFWVWMIRKGKTERNKMYAIAVTACRAYCEDRILRRLEPSKTDILEWTANWDVA